MINNNIGDVKISLVLQFYSQVFQSGCLQKAQVSAGLKKSNHCHCALGVQHWILISYVPGWSLLTSRALALALCSSIGEETESQGKPQASPHCWGFRNPFRLACVFPLFALVRADPQSHRLTLTFIALLFTSPSEVQSKVRCSLLQRPCKRSSP